MTHAEMVKAIRVSGGGFGNGGAVATLCTANGTVDYWWNNTTLRWVKK